jgi:hypothetical protein
MDASRGIDINAYAQHGFRFLPRNYDQMKYSIRVYNSKGRVRITSFIGKSAQSQFAKRNLP